MAQPLSPLDWHVDQDSRLAVAYRLDAPGWLVLYAFASLANGLVDLIAVRVEAYNGTLDQLADEVQRIVEYWSPARPTHGLKSRYLRVSLAGGELLSEARNQLDKLMGLLPGWSGKVRKGRRTAATGDRDDVFYARLVLEYDALLRELPPRGGARRELARRQGSDETTVENWIKEARRRGFWITSGPGKPGQASAAAHETSETTK